MTDYRIADKIKIDIVSDVMCPWCIIGFKRLEKAIEELGMQDQVELEWQPFELNPDMPVEGEDIQEHIAWKYGSTPESSKRSRDHMAQLGEELNFHFDYFEGMRIVNTREAHILLDYAMEEGKQTELSMRLVTAHFSERKDVSKRCVLLDEIEMLGLNIDVAKSRLEDESALARVIKNEKYWQSCGITAVPTIIFDGKRGLTGAQTLSVYKQELANLTNK